MINFIICDDNAAILNNVYKIVTSVMMSSEQAYDIHSFEEYDSKFYKIMDSKISNKIYILDIETKRSSGIDIARKIRSKDVNSIIIFLTSHHELGSVLLRDEIMFLTFINKLDDYENRLISAVKKSIDVIGKNKILRFEHHGTIFTIPEKDIIYITRDGVERKIIIKTDCTDFKLTKSLSEMVELLSNDFVYSHRSCIVNKRRIMAIDKRKKKITFDNGEVCDLLSSKLIKGVVK